MNKKIKVILAQVGSPKSTSTKDVREYLKEFLGTYRVIDIPKVFWNIILYCFILPFRPRQSAKAYKRIEKNGKFPLVEFTHEFASKVQAVLEQTDKNISVEGKFILSEPRLSKIFIDDCEVDSEPNEEKVLLLPQFPQYSETTTACCYDEMAIAFDRRTKLPALEVILSYHTMKGFIDCSVRHLEEKLKGVLASKQLDEFVLSFHGVPVRYITTKKDVYYRHCFETFSLIVERLSPKFPDLPMKMTFQSRLGSEEWLGPYTDEYVVGEVEKGRKNIAVYCPSFVVDCLETEDEIGNELAEEVEEAGGHLEFIPCLNVNQDWVEAYANFINVQVNGSKTEKDELFYTVDKSEIMKEMPPLKEKSNPMDPKAKKTVKLVFLTLFLDIIGFSIIFPMFPALAKYYLEVDADNPFLQFIFGSIAKLTEVGGADMSSIVLFGGALGALYSILQFFAAPIWGGLSDRFGRRPTLIISIFGLFISYVLWVFSGSFTLLILARFIGGIMGGNLSVASAAVADVTDETNRSKGMAYVGIAFALGFIFGPALGGLLTTINPIEHFPSLEQYGVNPFSYPALLAAVLSLANCISIYRNFEETLAEKDKKTGTRSANILKLLTPLKDRNINLTNYGYFLFISAFSGMEFTLTFLAVERLAYTSMDNAYMFIFIGFIIAFVQGGYVRRKAHDVGEKRMAIMGLVSVIPGLLILGFAKSTFLIYFGLFFLAVGSAMAIPTLTSLVSLLTPASEQGRSLGVFRSLGSLGRVIGPIAASLIYWKFGSEFPYILGSLFLIIPIILISRIEQKKSA